MLRLFTELLQDFLIRQIVPANRVFVDPPDRDFVRTLPRPGQSVNVYLADIRENRKLRTNERQRKLHDNGTITESLFPSWIDAHYLISVWDPSTNPGDRQRPLREQQVMSKISAALLAGDPLTPAEVYAKPTDAELDALGIGAGSAAEALAIQARKRKLEAWPVEFRLPGLPFQVLPPEGFAKLSEFWTTMGQGSVWRPVVYLVASVPVLVVPTFVAPIVTTLTTMSGITEDAASTGLVAAKRRTQAGVMEVIERVERDEQRWHQIGGFVHGPVLVRDPNDPDFGLTVRRTLKDARVLLQIGGDARATPPAPPIPVEETRTNAQGQYHFVFAAMPVSASRRYQVIARYSGLHANPLDVDLNPSARLPHDIEMA